jgi:hypothetical protein
MKIALLMCLSVLFLSCVPKTTAKLQVVAIPTNPILIPAGSSTFVNGIEVSPPYFILSQLRIAYSGTLQAQILLVELSKPSTGGAGYTCVISGDDLKYIFLSDLDTNGQVVISANDNIASAPFACAGVPITNPNADFFNIPLTVKVTAAIVDPANPLQPTARATGTASITVQ